MRRSWKTARRGSDPATVETNQAVPPPRPPETDDSPRPPETDDSPRPPETDDCARPREWRPSACSSQPRRAFDQQDAPQLLRRASYCGACGLELAISLE